MFENLVECNGARIKTHNYIYFLATSFTWTVALTVSILAGIFFYDAKLNEQLSLMTMLELLPPPPPAPMGRPAKPQVKSSGMVATATSPVRNVPETIELPKEVAFTPASTPTPGAVISDEDLVGVGDPNGIPGGIMGGLPNGVVNSTTVDAARKLPEPPKLQIEEVAPPAASQIVRRSEGVIRGNSLVKIVPDYPELARQARIQGDVQIELTIDEEGSVKMARIISGHPVLQKTALEAARKWKFNPTVLNGTPVKVQGILTFRFSI
ncbi:MAG: TonB family protein [Blastocatellia bacterium]|nr:TonB family protein [Blastocatellia bacterium]